MQEMSRFLHFYTRFKNHENSQKLEEPLLIGVRQKMEVLASSLGLNSAEETGEKGMKFIEDGVRELLKARRVLCGSYVYGYYLEDDGYNKTIFEFMQVVPKYLNIYLTCKKLFVFQNELEEVTEKLSEMIARPYLRTPKTVIMQTTSLARRKRHEFVRAVAQGLIPPETPPFQRKSRKRRYLDVRNFCRVFQNLNTNFTDGSVTYKCLVKRLRMARIRFRNRRKRNCFQTIPHLFCQFQGPPVWTEVHKTRLHKYVETIARYSQ